MTREELRQEAEEFRKNLKEQILCDDDFERLEQFDVNVEQAYIVGAEPREKRIEELEEENKKLKRKTRGNNLLMSTVEKLTNVKIELEKENKDLRIHQTNAVLNCLEMKVLKDSHRDRANKTQDQLTKAKELLKRCYEDYIYLKPLRSEIEQFLKDLEK